MRFCLALIEWPADPDGGGPRLLGRIEDADLVEEVRERLLAARQREIARLRPATPPTLRPVPDDGEA